MNNENSKSFSSVTEPFTAIISVIPIVSIAGSTLSRITTTTTSTCTTPSPAQTPSFSEQHKRTQSTNKADPNTSIKSMSYAVGHKSLGKDKDDALSSLKETDINTSPNEKSDSELKESESIEESLLKDYDESCLKKLLEEAYSYKNPRDKENKSKLFLHILQEVEKEKEEQSSSFRALTSRQQSTIHNQQHYHNIKQGGSLQDLVNVAGTELFIDCDYIIGGNQRCRRHNHNSRQKKYSSSISLRQREGGSLPSNVNVINSGGLLKNNEQSEQLLFMNDTKQSTSVNTGNLNVTKQYRRNSKSTSISVKQTERESSKKCFEEVEKDSYEEKEDCTTYVPNKNFSGTMADVNNCVIEMEEVSSEKENPRLEESSQTGEDNENLEKLCFYDRVENMDLRIPCVSNIVQHKTGRVNIAPCSTPHYVDERIVFTTLDRNNYCRNSDFDDFSETGNYSSSGNTTHSSKGNSGEDKGSSNVIPKYLPLDENYIACSSVLGIDDRTKTFSHQFDENGNSLNEDYQTSAQSGTKYINVLSNVPNLNSTNIASQSKIKNKKKTHQERNTKTVDVKSVAGYRGNDPIDMLVKYIENTKEKQIETKGSKLNENCKKKERKKDKEKQNKMKRSNSLEELRSCAKIDIDDMKQSAATTESNLLLINNKTTYTKNSKKNSLSVIDINKNFECPSGKSLNECAFNAKCNIEREFWDLGKLHCLDRKKENVEQKLKDKRISKCKENEISQSFLIEKDGAKKIEKEKYIEKVEKYVDTKDLMLPGSNKICKKKKSTSFVPSLESSSRNLLELNDFNSETAEFHVVTKRKKTKKKKLFPISDPNNGSSAVCTNEQQVQSRFKCYYSQNNNERNDYSILQQPNSMSMQQAVVTANKDKSRRKSTSSMPSSDKSDSSDLESVQSLPIESTSEYDKNKKVLKNTAASLAICTDELSNKIPVKFSISISYADIAKTNKQTLIKNSIQNCTDSDNSNDKNILNSEQPTGRINAAYILTSKTSSKKPSVGTEFPELVTLNNGLLFQKVNLSKNGTYFRSSDTTTQPVVTENNSENRQISSENLVTSKGDKPTESIQFETNAFSHVGKVRDKQLAQQENDPKPQFQQKRQIQAIQKKHQFSSLQKSKSVEHEWYNCDRKSMDQQYPALKKTLKPNANVSANPLSLSYLDFSTQLSTKFNFAAAAKQQKNTNDDTLIASSSNDFSVSINDYLKEATLNSTNRQTKNEKQEKLSDKKYSKYNESIQIQVGQKNQDKPLQQKQLEEYKECFQTNMEQSSQKLLTKEYKGKKTLATKDRPAVIILNDDKNSDYNNEFTFGDFNQDELMLINCNGATNEDLSLNCSKNDTQSKKAVAVEQRSKTSVINFNSNDSEAYIDYNDNDDIAFSTIDASLADTSFITNHSSNQSNDSGNENGVIKKTIKDQINGTDLNNENVMKPAHLEYADDKKKSVYTKLETCNGIESAIIAAAQAAAGKKWRKNQEKCNNFSLSFNSFNMNSSTSFKVASPVQSSQIRVHKFISHYINDNEFENYYCEESNNLMNDDEIETDNDYIEKYDESHFPSNSCNSVDLKTLVPVGLNNNAIFEALQHNSIVDFIESAWNEIVNSSVTEYYEGK